MSAPPSEEKTKDLPELSVFIRQFDPTNPVDNANGTVVELFNTLLSASADAAASGAASVYAFAAASECLFFGSVLESMKACESLQDSLYTVAKRNAGWSTTYSVQPRAPDGQPARNVTANNHLQANPGISRSEEYAHIEPYPFNIHSHQGQSSGSLDDDEDMLYQEPSNSRSFIDPPIIRDYVPRPPPSWYTVPESPTTPKLVGVAYLMSSPAQIPGEASIGLVLKRELQKKGHGQTLVHKLLKMAFDEFCFHRVQAAVMDCEGSANVIKLFVSMGFTLEGVRRLSVKNPVDSSYKNVTMLAMLDTDWLLARYDDDGKPLKPISRWDEMFSRHAKEREDLLASEDGRSLKRSASTETLRPEPSECSASVYESGTSESGMESDSDAGDRASTRSVSPQQDPSWEIRNPFIGSSERIALSRAALLNDVHRIGQFSGMDDPSDNEDFDFSGRAAGFESTHWPYRRSVPSYSSRGAVEIDDEDELVDPDFLVSSNGPSPYARGYSATPPPPSEVHSEAEEVDDEYMYSTLLSELRRSRSHLAFGGPSNLEDPLEGFADDEGRVASGSRLRDAVHNGEAEADHSSGDSSWDEMSDADLLSEYEGSVSLKSVSDEE